MQVRYQVFISSTFSDLEEERRSVERVIRELDHIPVGMELFPSADNTAWEFIEQNLDNTDYFVLIIGGRYGTTDESGISFTEREYDRAMEKGIPVLPFLHKNPDEISKGKSEMDKSAQKKLAAFRKKIEKEHHCKYWIPADLSKDVALALVYAINYDPRQGWVRGDLVEDSTKLLRRINELDEENGCLRQAVANAAEQNRYDEFRQGSDEIELTFRSKEGELCISVTLHKLFLALAPHLIVPTPADDLAYLLLNELKSDGILNKKSLSIVRAQLIVLDLIDISSVERMYEHFERQSRMVGSMMGMPRHFTIEKWCLSERGRRIYASSVALRRTKNDEQPG